MTNGIHLYPVFLEFVDIMYNGEMNEKIKLLYRLHIPPGKKAILGSALSQGQLCAGQ